MAAYEGNVDVVRLLAETRAHVNLQTEVYTFTLIQYFIEYRHVARQIVVALE